MSGAEFWSWAGARLKGYRDGQEERHRLSLQRLALVTSEITRLIGAAWFQNYRPTGADKLYRMWTGEEVKEGETAKSGGATQGELLAQLRAAGHDI